MKTHTTRLLVILLLALPVVAKAQLTYVTNNGALTITAYRGYGRVLLLPSATNGLPVIGIGDHALTGGLLSSITIPASITNIAATAFAGPSSLLTNLTVEAGNPAYSSSGGVLFNSDQTALLNFPSGRSGSYTVPEGVTSVGAYAFYGCPPTLTNLTLASTVSSIGAYAFAYARFCSLSLPDSVTNIADSAFASSAYLTNLTLGNGVVSIGPSAFSSCSALTSLTIPGSVSTLAASLCNKCTSLSNLTILNGVSSIGNSAFSGCSSLATLALPDSITSIGNSAFSGCTSLATLALPDSITSLGVSLFYNCSLLTNVVLPRNLTTIPASTFSGCSHLPGVMIPPSVTSIGNSAFQNCTGLTNFSIPSGVTSIAASAFAYCSGLSSVELSSTVTNIALGAFIPSCFRLTAFVVATNNPAYCSVDGVLFDKGQTTLLQFPTGRAGTYAVPAGVTSIGAHGFDGCFQLTQVSLPAGLTNIGSAAFRYCYGLSSLTVPSSVTSIGDEVFSLCYVLNALYFQGDAPTVGLWAGPTTVYYLPNTSGWDSMLGGATTMLWNPQVQSGDGSFGVGPAGFGFNIVGTTNIPIMVEACTNLGGGSWMPLLTTNLTVGSVYFTDPQWTNSPCRFYRLRSP